MQEDKASIANNETVKAETGMAEEQRGKSTKTLVVATPTLSSSTIVEKGGVVARTAKGST